MDKVSGYEPGGWGFESLQPRYRVHATMVYMPYVDPDIQRAYQRDWIARNRLEWIAAHGPCVDCGSWDELQVDHVDATTKVAHRIWSWSRERREAELVKCVVRCQPCHARKTTRSGERPSGAANGRSKLSAAEVRLIRASPKPYRELADEFGVFYTTIGRIKRREIWRDF